MIGGGWGGYTAAVRCRQHGLSVALVERDKLGGSCLHRGCIPTKALLQSAETLDLARRIAELGVRIAEPSLEFDVVVRRKEQIVGQLYAGLQRLVKSAAPSSSTATAGWPVRAKFTWIRRPAPRP